MKTRSKKQPRRTANRRVRKSISTAIARVQNQERMALMAGDTELSAAIKLASGMPVTDPHERQAAISSGMYGNTFSARFDAAITTTDNVNHWSMADGLAADAAANPMIRYILRNRSRYEIANNCYARGMVDTLATDLIGTGPRLQMETGSELADQWIEAEFARWMRTVKFVDKITTMAKAKIGDGESFGLEISNPASPLPVKLDLRVIEADQVRFVDISLLSVPSVDGIRFDDFGNPVSYHVLRVHPGFWSYATGYIGFPWEYDVWPAKFVHHLYRSDRPGQHRGLPELMAALPLLAQVRRYILAVLQAAETAADFAMWMKTPTAADGMTDSDEVVEVPNPFDLFPLQRNIVTTLPDGYEIGQTKPNQPVDRIDDFVRVLLRQVARVKNTPYNVVSGDFSQGNYSESNLGSQGYFRQIDKDRKDLEYTIVDRFLASWMFEARNARSGSGDFGDPYMPAEVRQVIAKSLTGNASDLPNHTWNWVGHEWANPAQGAQADQINLRMGTKSYANVCGRTGNDYRKIHASNAKALGLTIEEYREKVLIPNLLEKPQQGEVPPETGAEPSETGAEPSDNAKQETAVTK